MRNGEPLWSNDIRWIECVNGGASEIPPFGLVRCTEASFSGGVLLTVDQPNTDSQTVYVNGISSIPVGGRGVCTLEAPCHALYDSGDGTPTVGEDWGAGAGSFKLRKNKTGFKIIGGPSDGLVLTDRTGGGGSGSVYGASADESYFMHCGSTPFTTYYTSLNRLDSEQYFFQPEINYIYAVPFVCPGFTVDKLAMFLVRNGPASCKCRLAIYSATSATNLWPNAMVVESAEIALNSGASYPTNGVWKTDSVSATLNAGTLYWLCYIQNSVSGSTPQILGDLYENLTPTLGYGTAGSWLGPGLKVSQSYGAYPSTFPSYSSSYFWGASGSFEEGPFAFVHLSGAA